MARDDICPTCKGTGTVTRYEIDDIAEAAWITVGDLDKGYIRAIKTVREMVPGTGLREAKEAVDRVQLRRGQISPPLNFGDGTAVR